jgi:hypothetical protein
MLVDSRARPGQGGATGENRPLAFASALEPLHAGNRVALYGVVGCAAPLEDRDLKLYFAPISAGTAQMTDRPLRAKCMESLD